jgi:hypothetical protein
MNRLLILLMIALLPLRGWAGDQMSLQMAFDGFPAQVVGVLPTDCPMKLIHASVSAEDKSNLPAGNEGCTSCGLCLPIAELASLRFDVIAFVRHRAPPMDGVDFFSASLALALKPPIS